MISLNSGSLDEMIDKLTFEYLPNPDNWTTQLDSALLHPQCLLEVRQLQKNVESQSEYVWTVKNIKDWLTPDQFEKLLSAYYSSNGYDCVLTRHNDKGVDLVCRKEGRLKLIEAKHKGASKTVGRPTIQKIDSIATIFRELDEVLDDPSILDKAQVEEIVVVSPATFSEEAVEMARTLQTERGVQFRLIGGDELTFLLNSASIWPGEYVDANSIEFSTR